MYVYDKKQSTQRKTSNLIEIVIHFLRIYPEITTINPFANPEFKLNENQTKKAQKLYKMLVHMSTIINSTYRTKNKYGHYVSQEEDMVNALAIMKDLILYYDIRKGHYEHEILAILAVLQSDKGGITNKSLREYTGYSKTRCTLILSTFLDRGWIIRSGGNRKAGFTYSLTIES